MKESYTAHRPAKRPVRKPGKQARKIGGLKGWAYAGIGVTLVASGWLNGLAFSQSAPNPGAGWTLGIAIPILVLIFARVSALLYIQGRRGLAAAGAGATGCILLLSVQHLATAIARLTGEHVALAALMALAVDVGLVVCEIATVKAK